MGNIITNYLLKKGIIEESDIEIYQYGEFVFLFNLLLIIFAILFAFFIGEVKFIISFFVFCIPLRIFLGGFHCTTPFRCFVFSELLYVVIILLYKFNIFCNYNLIIFFTLIACAINFIFNDKESKIVRLIVFLVFILELFVYFLLPEYSVHIIYGFFCCSFLYYYQFIILGGKYLINLIIV